MFYRIHIGRWTKQEDWLQQINRVTVEWLKKTPTVKITDNERYVFLDLLKRKYKSSSIQSWQEGGLVLGSSTYSKNNQGSHNTNIDTFISNKIDNATGKWKTIPPHVDGVILAYAMAKHVSDTKKIEPALHETIALIENNRGEDGTIFYRDFIPDIRFVDTIGFICPFLTFYGVNFNEPKYIDLAFHQIEEYKKKAFLESINIPAHAFDIKQNAPLGIYGWGRGLGWFILGLVDMYNELPKDHERKDFLKELIIKTADDTLQFQRENGSFGAMLFVKGFRHDSSITTLAGWLFLNAFKISGNPTYLSAAEKCIASLMKVTRRNGVIDFCQGDTKGIGDYAKTFDLMPFVQGLTVRLVVDFNSVIKKQDNKGD
ncbi:hypothetical protein GCM10022258_34820 [Aquimarina gracilis]